MRKARLLRGNKSLRDIESETGIDHSTIGKMETGAAVRLATAKTLATFYGVTIDELLAEVPESQEAMPPLQEVEPQGGG